MVERERSRLQCLNMTSTDDRRSRSHSYILPQGAPVPQPDFTSQGDVPRFQSPTGLSDPLEYLTPIAAAPTVGHHHVQAGPSRPAPQHHAGDVFGGVGLGGPTRYAALHFPMQNVQVEPLHLRPPPYLPQSDAGGIPQDLRGMNVDAPMHAPPHPAGFIYPGDDNPLRPHRTLPPVRRDSAFNNIHHGHITHRERQAVYRQSA
jgi:hypothetical protein